MKYKSTIFILTFMASGYLQAITLTALGNQGVMLRSDETIVYVDALYKHYEDWEGFSYDKPVLTLKSLKKNSGVKSVFIATHVHRDHFHPYLMGEVLNDAQSNFFLGGTQTVESIKEAYFNEHQIRGKIKCIASPECNSEIVYSDSLRIAGIVTEHNHQLYDWIENIAFHIDFENQTILHLGDAALSLNNINYLKSARHVDIAIVPYWFMSNKVLLHRFLIDIAPSTVLISHFPQGHMEAIKNYTESIVEELPTGLKKVRFEVLPPGGELILGS